MDGLQPLPISQSLTVTHAVSADRRAAFAQVVKTVPTNDLGLPRFLYRTDMIPSDIFVRSQSEREQILSAAVIPVIYEEGFPAFEDGQPIWSQLPFESPKSFAAFGKYLEVGTNDGVRLVETVAMELEKTLPELMDYFHLYYWKFRAKAYDLYISTVHEKKRLRRLMKCEDDHYILADNLLKQCVEYFEALNWESISPEAVARMIPALTEIQRKALGAAIGAAGGGSAPAQSVEVILRQMTRNEGGGEGGVDGGVGRNANLDLLLTNPDAAESAQELIIKLTPK